MNYNFEKKKSKKLIFIVAIAVIVLAVAGVIFAQSFSDNKGYRTISVVEVSGNVGVVKDGIEYAAYPGMLLQEGHEIITMGNSYVRLVLDDDKYVKLESGSKLVFETLGFLGSGKTSMKLERGSLSTELVKPLGADEEYVVNTPNAVLAVRGTFFRVEIDNSNAGKVTANVMTYGGSVASKRILPTGEVVKEEVLIDAGYKTTINKDAKDTVYVVEDVEGTIDATGDGKVDLAPIKTEDIPDDDLVDVYFAAENGHELFITVEEAKENIENREIVLEEKVSVYEKAEEVKKEQEAAAGTKTNSTSSDVIANDSKPLQKEEDKPETEENIPVVAPGIITDGDAKPHTHKYIENITAEPDCEKEGEKTFTCDCGDTYTEVIAALGHKPVNDGDKDCHSRCHVCGKILSADHESLESTRTEATCEKTGSVTYKCDCGYEYTEVIEALGHTEVNGGTEDCHKKCDTCGEILSAEHTYTENIVSEATCTASGLKKYSCDCGYEYTEEIEATGHTEVNGGTEDCHIKCDVCGEILSTEHEFTENIIYNSDCIAPGEKMYSCDCGYDYTEEIPATGHGWYDWMTLTEATCEKDGVKTRQCGYCLSSEEESIPALGHDYATEFTLDAEATCTTAGSQSKHCSRCDSKSEVTEIPMTGHTPVDGATADCHSKCDVCGETLSEEHEFTENIIYNPDCEDIGSKMYSCDCGYDYTEEIEALGHDYDTEFTVDIEATCTTAGSQSKHCSRCDSKSEVTEIPMTGHTPVDGATADCHSKCDVCDEVLNTEHNAVESDRTEPSCEITGLVVYSCDCGYEYDEVIPETGHNYVAKIDEPTNTENGRTYEQCSNCDDIINEKVIVALNTVNFPDDNFLSYLESGYNTDGVAGLSQEEISTITSLVLKGEGSEGVISLDGGISDLAGIEYLTELTTLDVSYNANLTSLDLSANTKLVTLNAACTGITSIDISGCIALESLNLGYCTSLTELDLTANTELVEIIVNNTGLSDISLASVYYYTTWLDIRGTSISEFKFYKFQNLQIVKFDASLTSADFESNNYITDMYIGAGTGLNTLNITMVTLENVVFEGITGITEIQATQAVRLKSINTSYCPELTQMYVSGTSINEVDFSQNTKLEILSISDCHSFYYLDLSNLSSLQALHITNCSLLQFLNVSKTGIYELDLTGCTMLTSVTADNTAISSLDLTPCASTLTTLSVRNCTSLTSLDTSMCTNLTSFDKTGSGLE